MSTSREGFEKAMRATHGWDDDFRWDEDEQCYVSFSTHERYFGWLARDAEVAALKARIEELEAQGNEAVKMLSEQDFKYNRATNKLIERHAEQASTLTYELFHLNAIVESQSREIDAISRAIGCEDYLDPPDGGGPDLAEQVRRMKADRDALKARVEKLEHALHLISLGSQSSMGENRYQMGHMAREALRHE